MNVGELLDELRSNLLRDVSDAVGDDAGLLFSDASLVRYLTDAHNKAARQTLCIREASDPDMTRITLTEGVAAYTLDPRVVRVYSVSLGEAFRYRPLKHAGQDTMTGVTEARVEAVSSGVVERHDPTHYTTDEGSRLLRLFATPGVDYDQTELHLRVARLPRKAFSPDNLDAVPEIPEDYHLDLVEWAAFRALRNHDVDAENIQKANSHRAAFDRAMAELKAETKRLHFSPVVFGGRVNN